MNTIAVCTLNVAPQIMKQIPIMKCHGHYNFEATRVSGKFRKPSTLQPFPNTARFLERKASCICLTSTPYRNGRIWSVISKTPAWNPGTQLHRRIAPRLQQRVSQSPLGWHVLWRRRAISSPGPYWSRNGRCVEAAAWAETGCFWRRCWFLWRISGWAEVEVDPGVSVLQLHEIRFTVKDDIVGFLFILIY